MPHVGVQRLGPGHAQHDRAQHDEGEQPVVQAQRRPRRSARAPAARTGCCTISHSPSRPIDEEPDRHDRAEHAADTAGAVRLHGEQREDHDDADRQRRIASARAPRPRSPSTADSTEIAGVMTPSPKNRQAPAMPISVRARAAYARRPRPAAPAPSAPVCRLRRDCRRA